MLSDAILCAQKIKKIVVKVLIYQTFCRPLIHRKKQIMQVWEVECSFCQHL